MYVQAADCAYPYRYLKQIIATQALSSMAQRPPGPAMEPGWEEFQGAEDMELEIRTLRLLYEVLEEEGASLRISDINKSMPVALVEMSGEYKTQGWECVTSQMGDVGVDDSEPAGRRHAGSSQVWDSSFWTHWGKSWFSPPKTIPICIYCRKTNQQCSSAQLQKYENGMTASCVACMTIYQNQEFQCRQKIRVDYDPTKSNREDVIKKAKSLGMTRYECKRRKYAGPCYEWIDKGYCFKDQNCPHMHGMNDTRG